MIADLVIDVGMNDGRDTAFYLHRGFRVVAIDANPEMIAAGARRFTDALRANRLKLLNFGIAATAGRRTLYFDRRDSGVASLNPEHLTGHNRIDGSFDVDCVPFADVLREHGVPYYLKIDIETADRLCLESLRGPDLPRFVSWEKGADALECLALVRALGYDRFKLINQVTFLEHSVQESILTRARGRLERLLGRPARPFRTHDGWEFTKGCSGPFAMETSGRWSTYEEMLATWSAFARRYPEESRQSGWYDFHAWRSAG